MRTVKDILNTKTQGISYVAPDSLVIDALLILSSTNSSYVVVMDENKFRGVFCERDYARKVVLYGRSSVKTMVREIMTADLPVVKLKDTVEYCMNLMNGHRVRYLVAVDENHQFVNIITINDLLRQVIAEKEEVFDNHITDKLLDTADGLRIY